MSDPYLVDTFSYPVSRFTIIPSLSWALLISSIYLHHHHYFPTSGSFHHSFFFFFFSIHRHLSLSNFLTYSCFSPPCSLCFARLFPHPFTVSSVYLLTYFYVPLQFFNLSVNISPFQPIVHLPISTQLPQLVRKSVSQAKFLFLCYCWHISAV